jgi:lipopolysaccharide transport system permease protein
MLNSLVNVFLTNANILKKQLSADLFTDHRHASAFINFLIILVCSAVSIVTGNFPGMIFFEIIPVLIVQMLFTLGLGIILGVLNVFVRDVGQFVNILLQFGSGLRPLSTSKTLPEWSLVCWRITRWRPLSVHTRT